VGSGRSKRAGWAVPALLGGAGLVVGAFAPAVVVDYWGPVSLNDVAQVQSLLVVGAGAVAAAAALLRRPRWVRPAALVAWIGVLLPLIRNALAPEPGFLERLGNEISGPVSDELGHVALQLTAISWGGAVLIGGLLLVSLAAWRAA
jgi:hypothetical protein